MDCVTLAVSTDCKQPVRASIRGPADDGAGTRVVQIVDEGHGTFVVEKKNLADAVLWNPWVDKAKATADFGDEEYHNMVCLEPAQAGSGPATLPAGEAWSCIQKLTYTKA